MGPPRRQHHQNAENRLHDAGQHAAREGPPPGLPLLPQGQGNSGPFREVLDSDAHGQRRRAGKILPRRGQGEGQPHRHALRHIM